MSHPRYAHRWPTTRAPLNIPLTAFGNFERLDGVFTNIYDATDAPSGLVFNLEPENSTGYTPVDVAAAQ